MSFEEKLISAVFLRPYIYNKADLNHSKKGVLAPAWADISKEAGKPEADCKRRWRSLRDTFYKHKKSGTSGSESDGKSHTWTWFESLLFLSEYNDPQSTSDNFEDIEMFEVEEGEANGVEENVDSGPSHSKTPNDSAPNNSEPKNSQVLEKGGASKKRGRVSLAEQWGKVFEKVAGSDQQVINSPTDPVTDSFAKYISCEMGKLNETEKDEFKWEVANTLRNIKLKRPT